MYVINNSKNKNDLSRELCFKELRAFEKNGGVFHNRPRVVPRKQKSVTIFVSPYLSAFLQLHVSNFTYYRKLTCKKGGTVEKLLVAFKNFFSKLFYFSTCSTKMSNALSFSRWGTLFLIRANSHKGISSTNMKKENFSMK